LKHIISNQLKQRRPRELPSDTLQSYTTLSNTIRNVESKAEDIIARTRLMRRYYDDLSSIDKVIVKSTLEKVKELALLMRGWDGVSTELPIRSVPPTDYSATTVRVSPILFQYVESWKTCPQAVLHTLNLPLVVLTQEQFRINVDPSKGLTIRDRLEIVKAGHNGTNGNSCIRMSSNNLLYSVAFYMKAIGANPGYEAGDVRYIS
jgi:hypothetical protein